MLDQFPEFAYSVRKLCEILRDRSAEILERDEELNELVEELEQQLDEYTSHEDDENLDI